MEEEKRDGSNLPIEVKNKGLLSKPAIIKTMDGAKRAGKVISSTILSLAGLGVFGATTGPVALIGGAIAIGSLVRGAQNVNLKIEPTLLFGSKKTFKGNIAIFQDPLNPNLMSRMAGYSNGEKMNMMGVQTLVGLARYKSILQNSPCEIDENGNKVYDQVFSTVTHGINLRSLEHLEKLGYIKLDSIDADFKPETIDEIFTARKRDNGEVKSNLLFEKIGFGNFKDVGKILKEAVSKNKETEGKSDAKKYVMKKASFRLTDKPIDFDEMVKYTDPSERTKLPKEQRMAAGWFAKMIRSINDKNVQIVKDATGRPKLKYPSRIENIKMVAKNIKEHRASKNVAAKKMKIEPVDNKDLSKEEKADIAAQQMKAEQEKFNKSLQNGVKQPVLVVSVEQSEVEQSPELKNVEDNERE